jgi:hypothetical protein
LTHTFVPFGIGGVSAVGVVRSRYSVLRHSHWRPFESVTVVRVNAASFG